MTISKGGKFTNIYIGNGMKRGDACMNPVEPPEVCGEPVDLPENPEPTPLHEPVIVAAGDPAEGDPEEDP